MRTMAVTAAEPYACAQSALPRPLQHTVGIQRTYVCDEVGGWGTAPFLFLRKIRRGAQLKAAAAARSAIVEHMDALLRRDGVLLLPTARGAAPPVEPPAGYEGPSGMLLAVGGIAALGGLPQAGRRPVPALPVPVHLGAGHSASCTHPFHPA